VADANSSAAQPKTKGLFIKTYGCQMNVYDSERMRDVLKPLGYEPVDAPEQADLVVLNTCHIREKATEKMFSELGRLRDMKAEGGGVMRIAVAGCVAQAEGEEIMRRQPAVDMVVGPQAYHRLPEMIARLARKTGDVLETDFAADEKFDALPKTPRCRWTIGFPVGAGRLRQVLFVLRRAIHARGGVFARRRCDHRRIARAGAAGCARDRADRPECERMARRCARA
jgi:hypothetical protein